MERFARRAGLGISAVLSNHTCYLYTTYRSTIAGQSDVDLAGLQSERCTSCKGVFLARSREPHARPRPNGYIPPKKLDVGDRQEWDGKLIVIRGTVVTGVVHDRQARAWAVARSHALRTSTALTPTTAHHTVLSSTGSYFLQNISPQPPDRRHHNGKPPTLAPTAHS